MNIQQLRYFVELARSGSFYAAAKNAFISQQGLNKAIRALETELDTSLVEREQRGVRLTQDGELFLAHAERIIAEYDLFAKELVERHRATDAGDTPISVYVSYYGAQIASGNPDYIGLVASGTAYHEGPFDKLLLRAASSDGSDLVFLDLHGETLAQVQANPDVVFEPIITTRAGIVWADGSMVAGEPHIHRSTVQHLPFALCANREIARFTDWLFREAPLDDVRLESSSPRMLLSYVHESPRAVALFDSFGFFLAQKDAGSPAASLHFTPFSTPEAICQVGFLYPKGAKMSLRARHTVNVLKEYLASTCGEYFAEQPTRMG